MKKADAGASGKADRKMDRKTRYAIIFAASAAILSLALGALAVTSAAIGSGDIPRAGSEAPAVTSAADTSPETGNSIIGAVIAVIVVIAIILVIIALMPRRKNG